MSGFTDRTHRQLDLITARLGAYRSGEQSLGGLIADLDALWNELRELPSGWRDEFRGHWWTLEQVHAVALDRGLEELPDDHRVLVDEAVDQLGFLVDAAMRDGSDDSEASSTSMRKE